MKLLRSDGIPVFFVRVCLAVLLAGLSVRAADETFLQAISHKRPIPPELGGHARQVAVDQDGIVCIITDKGVGRVFGQEIKRDQSYRPLAGRIATEISVYDGHFYYLYPEEILSNRRAGKFVRKLGERYSHFAVGPSNTAVLSSRDKVFLLKEGVLKEVPGKASSAFDQLLAWDEGFIGRAGSEIYRIGEEVTRIGTISGLNVCAIRGRQLYAGLTNGFITMDLKTGKSSDLYSKVPAINITALAFHAGNLWAGTTRGIWKMDGDGAFRYFASKRWLDDDRIIDLAVAPGGSVHALTKSGLNEIEFRPMTLAEKANWYDQKIRQRHLRYGFCSELHLKTPGDIATAEMIDTDNDGTWSNYYLASQAFRFGATGDPIARRNAWETFEALERLESINPLGGFPSRTFERTGFKVSDPDRWHPVGDGIWDWKAHTSSDEITAHMFGSAVLYETTARTAEEKQRIATFISKILDHIVRNDWYLIDVDGKPTLWARWNPEYVNGFPETMYDRRLNSAEIIAALQFGYAITGKELYKTKAFELMEAHGYLRNIMLPMSAIDYTPGFKHKGIEMGMDWNHSDDLLGFVAYWVLHRFAFNEELRAKYAAAIQDHWSFEKGERNPLWNFVYASTGAAEFDLAGALWTLRYFPMDLIDWSVANSQRADITRLPANFRFQELKELLPPDERRITRWNGQPFILDGGSGGTLELAGDEFLLPYCMGRYLKLIQ